MPKFAGGQRIVGNSHAGAGHYNFKMTPPTPINTHFNSLVCVFKGLEN